MAAAKNRQHRRPEAGAGDARATDLLLRLHGFSIVSRPGGGQPLWRSRAGRVLGQDAALLEARRGAATR